MAGKILIENKKDFIVLLIISVTILSVVIIWLVNGSSNTNTNLKNVSASDIDICQKDSDCIIVPYQDCGGPGGRKVINKKYKSLYEYHADWQKIDPKICAVIGMGPPDFNSFKTPYCNESRRCYLKK